MWTWRMVLVGAALLSPSATAAQQAGAYDAVDRVFDAWNSTEAAGCAVGVERDGHRVLSRAYGMADLEHDIRNTPATIFEAGSVSKQFTAAAVVLLVQDGLLQLDDDVRQYVPELPDYGTPITIRHLLTHTSGLRDWGSVAAIGGWGRSNATHTHDHVLDILSRQSALNFEPGTEYSYSNSGYNLLAIIVDRVSGMSFADFSRKRIFEPLGLRDTQWRDDYRRIVKNRSSAYAIRNGAWVIDRPIENVHGNGGLLTTVADLLEWNDALATGTLGGASFVEMMHEQGVLNSGQTIAYASGLVVSKLGDVQEISHTGATSGYRAFLARYPDQRLGVAVLCNAGNVNPGLVGRSVARHMLGQPPPVSSATGENTRDTSPAPLSEAAMEELTGEYYSADAVASFTVQIEGGRLVLLRRPDMRVVLRPVSEDVFAAGPIGRIQFNRDAAGGVTDLSVRQDRVYDLRFERTTPGSDDRGSNVPAIGTAEWEALLVAEDSRISTAAHQRLLLDALTSGNAAVRAMAVRALGRSERTEFVQPITARLDDSSVIVRAAAAHALGDVLRPAGLAGPAPDAAVANARAQLLETLNGPGAHDAAAAAAETLGRLPTDSMTAAKVAGRLTRMLDTEATRTGALRGLYFLARQPRARPGIGESHAQGLRQVISDHTAPAGTDAATGSGAPAASERELERDRARDRALAIATLAITRSTDEQLLTSLLRDPDAQVRREAVAATATLADTAAAHRIVDIAARDVVPAVRYDALRYRMTPSAAAGACAEVARAVRDPDAGVSLLAIDLLGTRCAHRSHMALLDSLAAGTFADGSPTGAAGATRTAGSWHRAAHAVLALAHVAASQDSASRVNDRSRASDRDRTLERVQRLAQHSSPFARVRAARAAAVLSDTTLLRSLATDAHPIVRTAAVTGLSATAGRAADETYLAQLAADDSELVMAAAAALEGTTDPVATTRLLDALDRITAQQRETSRDARVALLERVHELGDARSSMRLTRYLTDFDAEVARRAASVLEAWTGTRPDVQPTPLPEPPLPSFAEATQLARSVFVVVMADGREIDIRLLPFTAPTNAARFARLARSGYFDGLTFHRVVPNFVVQGGSPGASEYSGDGPFTRDELGAPNWRGTVGLSTRGRDTGDAQFYINLVDNVRLDHEYTVFGEVVSGMDVVDSLLEGSVIRAIREER